MKKFISKTLIFLLFIPIMIGIGLFTPTTPRASKSLLMANTYKVNLLKNTPAPRIIFIGGSNLSFGLNSQIVKDSLQLHPINTAIHASIGIKFMMDNASDYIQKGDVVILVPEYSHYYRSLNFGSEELMRTVFDVNLSNIKYFNPIQLFNILEFLPRYSLTKYKSEEYSNLKESAVYSVNSFNPYGDVFTHWNMKQQPFSPIESIEGEFNDKVIPYFENFDSEIKKKGATLYVSFPSYQASSFKNCEAQIRKVEQALKKSKLQLLGSANRYKMPDSLMFDTPYHLLKKGVDYRTNLFIIDYKNRESAGH